MTCDRHGWAAGPPCPDCINEERQKRNEEQWRRERFVNMAVIYFYERRQLLGMTQQHLDRLRKDCWEDANALYEAGYPVRAHSDPNPPLMPR